MTTNEYAISMREKELHQLREALFSGDGKESVAFALCSTAKSQRRTRLLVREILELPLEAYLYRSSREVCWSTKHIFSILERVEKEELCLIKCHSHPEGSASFSDKDDVSDKELIPSFYQWNEAGPHGSMVLTEDNAAARIVTSSGNFHQIISVQIIGERIKWLSAGAQGHNRPKREQSRLVQAFGENTYNTLAALRVAVVGASGIGSLVSESLARTGVGELIVVDPDHIEEVNLNRILHSTPMDAERQLEKVQVVKRSIQSMGLGTKVSAYGNPIQNVSVLREIAGSDIIVGCVDSREARNLLNRISAFYLLPYIDAGVAIRASENGDIDSIAASINYFQPGQSFIARGIFDQEDIRSEAIQRTSPDHYQEQLDRGYIIGVDVDRPAVMPLNMMAAGYTIMELLARLHGYRGDLTDDQKAAQTLISLDLGIISQSEDCGPSPGLQKYIARGDMSPLLAMPAFSALEEPA